MSIIEVSSSAELEAAYTLLSNQEGGGEIVISSGAEDVAIRLVGGGDQHVVIRSADPENLATVTQIVVKNAENIDFRDLNLDSTGLDRGLGTYNPEASDFYVGGSSDISLDNITFTGQAEGIYDPNDPTASMGSIRYSQNVSITNSTIENYYHGIFLYESSGLTIEGNELTQLQGDGIRMEGVQDVRIADNYMHDFYGSPNANNHDDMIQMWTVNTQTVSRDIEIVDNVFSSANASGSQTILIQNEREQDNPDAWYQNITIANNVIYNSHLHGIRVSGVNGLDISNNTVLFNADSGLIVTGADDIQTYMPRIEVYAASNAVVTDNITGELSLSDGVISSGNHIVNYTNPNNPNYVDNHFVNVMTNGDADLRDLALLEDSSWLGSGAALSQPQNAIGADQAVMQMEEGSEDLWQQVFSADLSTVTGDNVTYVWTFSDGTTLTGQTVTHQFIEDGAHDATLEVLRDGEVIDAITRTLVLDNRNYLEFDFTQGLDEISGNDLGFWGLNEANLSEEGYHIGGADRFFISRSNEEIHGLDHFRLDVDLSLDQVGSGGTFFHLHGSIKASIGSSGQVQFQLVTNEGIFSVNSGDVVIDDLAMHRISIDYDAGEGLLVLSLDGEQVSQVEASGSTTAAESQHLVIGYAHGSSLNATIGSIYLGYDADRSGADLDLVETQDPLTFFCRPDTLFEYDKGLDKYTVSEDGDDTLTIPELNDFVTAVPILLEGSEGVQDQPANVVEPPLVPQWEAAETPSPSASDLLIQESVEHNPSEEALGAAVGTPVPAVTEDVVVVEEALGAAVGTPVPAVTEDVVVVEEALGAAVGTPASAVTEDELSEASFIWEETTSGSNSKDSLWETQNDWLLDIFDVQRSFGVESHTAVAETASSFDSAPSIGAGTTSWPLSPVALEHISTEYGQEDQDVTIPWIGLADF